jgi:hypothetical protein
VRTLSPGPLATAPSPALAGSWRIINTERWAHAPRRTYSSGPAQSAVPGDRKPPVAVVEICPRTCEDGGGANECLIKAERMRGAGPGLLGPGGPGESAVPDARATAVLVCTVAVAELVGWV